MVTTWGYNLKKGVNNSVSYSDSTPGIQYAYNHLNQLTQVTDASGSRVLTYTPYNEPDTDAITIEGVSCQVQEHYDAYGRASGYTLKQGTDVLQEVSQGYEANGRLASAGITHGGTEQRFAYGYLAGSSLLSSLAMPDGIVRELSYEQRRDLLSGLDCRLGETALVSRTQRCDALERPVTRTQRRGTEPAHSDSFSYNGRNELTGAALGAAPYGYSYDNIGNRKTAREPAQELAYAANELNQYTRIEENAEAPFAPQYDASGNQTLIRTSTGIWTVAYNAANRAVSFTSRDGATVVECGYDYQGRRYMKKVTQNGTVASHERYLYRGYLQIAALDMLDNRNVLRTLLWDPLEPMATRPLALVQAASLYCYGWDFNKNVTEVFDARGTIAATYDYSPYGTVGSTGSLVQPVQWSGEMHDEELALVYYNYRYYNPKDGRWINRDPIAEEGGWNLYAFLGNSPQDKFDALGLIGIFGLLGGALIDYGFQVTANYIQGKEDPWTDIDWGSVTTSAALGAAGIPGNVKIGKNIYKNVKEAVKMRKRIKNSQKIHICKEKLPTAHQKKLLKRKQKRENIYSEYKNEIKNNFLIGIIRGLAKNIGSEVYENYKNTLGNKYEKCCQDIIIIIIVEIEVEIKIDSFQQYENNNILEENPNYIPPTRPFYPLR
ncbi:RHS repeat domain-containing protein [Akkermansia muciniphila]|uniref:RHS repeat domain-containing protein n=1 Tax=Akkermansia muciniphila TaxID=239935 RepID=UPI00211EB671|nr:RHS repeat-associated core domain-containing protein [Akkermansia muciniphila]